MSTRTDGTLQCDVELDCTEHPTMLDTAGFVYCAEHGLDRREYEPCRKLRPHEQRKIERGEALARY